jgi:pimeloyl-ACP methyl ester carboxylesterase
MSQASSDSSSPSSAKLFFDEGGPASKVPVVFLHSSGGDTRHFTAQLAHLRRSRRAIAVDLPGHGQSPPAATFEIPAVAAVLEQALNAHGLERVVLVGHSWGGAVALALAAKVPQRVAGLLLLDPAADGTRMPKHAGRRIDGVATHQLRRGAGQVLELDARGREARGARAADARDQGRAARGGEVHAGLAAHLRSDAGAAALPRGAAHDLLAPRRPPGCLSADREGPAVTAHRRHRALGAARQARRHQRRPRRFPHRGRSH